MGKQVLLVASDFAPGKALKMLEEELCSSGIPTNLLRTKEPICNLPRATNMVITGMAHTVEAAKSELSTIQLAIKAMGVSIGLYADTFDCASRNWFAPYRRHIDFLFVPTNLEKMKAEKLFPDTQIVVTGNPLWEESAFPQKTREQVRTAFAVSDETRVILCPLRKEKELNLAHIATLREALKHVTGHQVLTIITTHPGDNSVRTEGLRNYHREAGATPVMFSELPIRDTLPGVDVVVNMASGAGIDAIMQRVPVVEVLTPAVLDEVERLHQRRIWQPVEDGVSLGVENAEELSSAICQVLTGTGAEWLRWANKHYPLPRTPRDAARKMVEFIHEYRRIT